jgi:hypothetical protein
MNMEKTQTDNCALSGIQIHDPSVWTDEDSLCGRPRGNCDRLIPHKYSILRQKLDIHISGTLVHLKGGFIWERIKVLGLNEINEVDN